MIFIVVVMIFSKFACYISHVDSTDFIRVSHFNYLYIHTHCTVSSVQLGLLSRQYLHQGRISLG